MATREEKKQATEQTLYDAAIGLFCEQGYKQTTLADIASEAGVSTRTLYKYFPTKESILRRFAKENILSLKAYASKLPADMPVKEKVLETMVFDYKTMFGLFDISYILHSARDESGMFARFEVENILTAESVYCVILRQEQLRQGIEPNDMVSICASIIMGLSRHCNDLYRFRRKSAFDEHNLRAFYKAHIDVIWHSLYQSLTTPHSGASPIAHLDKQLFDFKSCSH